VLIDWFTIIAQVINFLILIFLLKRFLYGPLIAAMKKREKRISDELRTAEKSRLEAERRALELSTEKEELAKNRMLLQTKAQHEVQKWQDEELEKAKIAVDAEKQKWLDAIDAEKEEFSQRLRVRLGRITFKLSKKALLDLADSSLEARVIETFLRKAEHEKDLLTGNQQISGPLTLSLKSGFALTDEMKNRLRTELHHLLEPDLTLTFAVEPDLGLGIELVAGDRKIEWNINRYILDIEKEVMRAMQLHKKGSHNA
jgi:F-type H+-transporting ATPase subunit b